MYDQGTMDTDLLTYIPGLSKIFYQGQIDNIMTKKTCATFTYTGKEILEFSINLTKNNYTKVLSILLCFPIMIRKKINVTQAKR